jgi:small subunit ribosomal protein S3Ae
MAKPKKSRKTSEKKKAKEWYAVLAPSEFDSKELGAVTTADEALLDNRIIKVSLMDLTGRMSQANMYTTLNFRIKEVKGKSAYTELIGHQLAPSYIRTLVRRRRTVLHTVKDLPTQDDRTVRLKMISVTKDRISDTMRKNIRTAIEAELSEASGKYNYYELMNEVISGKLSTRVFNRLRQITPMNRVEFRKTELKEDLAK